MQKRFSSWAAAIGLALTSSALAPMTARAQDGFQVVMSGLNNPHGLAFGPDGGLYVAEAGTGGPGPSIQSGDGSTVSYGTTGSVSRYLDGVQSQVITGLPSLADQTTMPAGASATGLQDIAFGPDGSLYGVIGLGADPSQHLPSSHLGALVKLTPGSSAVKRIASLGAYEAKHNPDGTDLNSNPYSLLALPGGFIVADAGANDVVGISAEGKRLATLAVLPPAPNPLPFGPPFYQAVPTALAVGPDRALYVGQLTGFPFPVGAANVFRVDPKTGATTVFAGGFTNIQDLAFGPDGSLYVLDLTTNGLAGENGPGSGALIKVDGQTGEQRLLASDGLFFPTALALGPDNAFYISNLGTSPGGGEVLRFAPPLVP